MEEEYQQPAMTGLSVFVWGKQQSKAQNGLPKMLYFFFCLHDVRVDITNNITRMSDLTVTYVYCRSIFHLIFFYTSTYFSIPPMCY